MAKRFEIEGRKFGRLTVVGLSRENGRLKWKCLCECGQVKFVLAGSLVNGRTKSCGCLNVDIHITHGMSRSVEYGIWRGMITRCSLPKTRAYKHYGGRGIKVCDRWLKFENFYADMGNRPSPELTIDRKDNDGDYEPSNCRWATRGQQSINQRLNRNNRSGLSGVYWSEEWNRWLTHIQYHYQQKNLGVYSNLLDACCARKSAEAKYWANYDRE